MSVLGLSATSDYTRSGYRGGDRRPTPESAPAEEAQSLTSSEPAPDLVPLDVAYYASRFKADLSRLKPPDDNAAPPTESDGDPHLYDFFGNLNVLLVAVRMGDLVRAQAAADALEMDLLVERSAGRLPADRGGLADLGRLFPAAPQRDVAFPPPIARRPDPYGEPPEAGGAAYDTLAHYFDEDTRTI